MPAHHYRCNDCLAGRKELRSGSRPAFEGTLDPVRVVDLFCGCGGMTLGIAQAARAVGRGLRIGLAIDTDKDAIDVYRANFPGSGARTGDVAACFGGGLGTRRTDSERRLIETLLTNEHPLDFLIGGPPCQGHSDLNNQSRRADPRNGLYLRMARAAEVLRPRAVIIENVPSVRHSSEEVVTIAKSHLEAIGYDVDHGVVDVSKLGVPQRRKRHVLIATDLRSSTPPSLNDVYRGTCPPTSVRWAIADLLGLEDVTPFNAASEASAENQRRMAWFFKNPGKRYDLPDYMRPPCHRDKDHSYKSVYGRLKWDGPAQTITTGFTSMGQGRYVHPARERTLTPHEAARLQGFPDYFSFGAVDRRTAWSKLIGNAVPPPLARAIALHLLPLIERERATAHAASA